VNFCTVSRIGKQVQPTNKKTPKLYQSGSVNYCCGWVQGKYQDAALQREKEKTLRPDNIAIKKRVQRVLITSHTKNQVVAWRSHIVFVTCIKRYRRRNVEKEQAWEFFIKSMGGNFLEHAWEESVGNTLPGKTVYVTNIDLNTMYLGSEV
jgi:hypothetical protein